jgi:hypothetical protein
MYTFVPHRFRINHWVIVVMLAGRAGGNEVSIINNGILVPSFLPESLAYCRKTHAQNKKESDYSQKV